MWSCDWLLQINPAAPRRLSHKPTIKLGRDKRVDGLIHWRLDERMKVVSTQAIAWKLATAGAPEGTVVVAETQTGGMGRLGRSWASPVGGLYASLILRPPASVPTELLPLLASVAVAQSLRATGVESCVRWPNDVTVHGRKLGGTIAASSMKAGETEFVTVGIGVDCNSRRQDLGTARDVATTLIEELGREVEIKAILDTILSRFGSMYATLLGGRRPVIGGDIFSTPGKTVRVEPIAGEAYEARAVRIGPDGTLELIHNGRRERLRTEQVRRLREL